MLRLYDDLQICSFKSRYEDSCPAIYARPLLSHLIGRERLYVSVVVFKCHEI